MAGPCDLTAAGRGALDQDRRLGPVRKEEALPGPERGRFDRRPPVPPSGWHWAASGSTDDE
jgi:hypothetical protein